MMWSEIVSDWTQAVTTLVKRFPKLDQGTLPTAPTNSDDFVDYLTHTHDLTPLEAREELRDWMTIQGLARDAGADVRAGYPASSL
jgi:hypothetical protein